MKWINRGKAAVKRSYEAAKIKAEQWEADLYRRNLPAPAGILIAAAGILVLTAGVVMLVTPGQGILTIFFGIMMIRSGILIFHGSSVNHEDKRDTKGSTA